MSAEHGAVGLAADTAAMWVRCYTARVGAEAAESRRAEIASDVWEQRTHGDTVDAPPFSVAMSIVWRVVGGMPADLVWSHEQRVVSRGRPPEREVPSMMTTLVGHWWWKVVAALIAYFFATMVVGNLRDPEGPYLGGTLLSAVCVLLVVGGLALRPRRRALGDVAIVVGSAPALVVIWFWPVAVAALVVVVCGLADLAAMRALRRLDPAR